MALGGAVVLVALAVVAWYLLVGRYYVSTDDAYVPPPRRRSRRASTVPSPAFPCMTPMHVHQGDVLATIDPSDRSLRCSRPKPISGWPSSG